MIATEITGVMVNVSSLEPHFRMDEAAPECFMEKFGMVYDIKIASEVGIFVFEDVVAMRAGNQQDAKFARLDCLDLGARHLLEQMLLAEHTGRIATAMLVIAEHPEAQAGFLKECTKAARNRLLGGVEGGAAADPVNDIALFSWLDNP